MREFHSYEEMSKEDFRALQMKAFQILVYFDNFCREHGLRYFLAGGTLIGAVRHKGFIPWDEDIDVHMPRPDYDRLPELWKKYADTKKYTLCITDETQNYHHHAYGITDNETTMIDKRNVNEDIAQGIIMDVIPFDGAPNGWIAEKVQLFWASIFGIYNTQRLPENQGGIAMRTIVKIMLGMIRNPHQRYKLWKYAEKQMKRYNFEKSKYVRETVASFRTMQMRYPRKNFDKPIYVEFEGRKFPAQHYYKQYLKNAFGDYMKLPPAEKRVPKGNVVYINLDDGYKNYKGKYYCCN